MEAKKRVDKMRKELSDGLDKYNRSNEFDDLAWRRSIQNGLLILKSDIKEDERRNRNSEETVSEIILWNLRNLPTDQLQKVYSSCDLNDYSFESFLSDCQEGTVPESILQIIALALPLVLDELKGEKK